MLLPGGLWHNRQRKRDFCFKPVTGALEFAIAEIAGQGFAMPEAVTKILQLALAQLGGEAVTEERVAELCIADRQFLMRQLQLHLGDSETWYSQTCRRCKASFDFELDLQALPVAEGDENYPFVEVELDKLQLRLRLPNGHDQAILADKTEVEIPAVLLKLCLLAQGREFDVDAFVANLSEAEVASIEQAMEQASPGIVTDIQVSCSNCSHVNPVYLDPYRLLNRGYGDLLAEIHRLARAYHWTEQQILALPAQRRAAYLAMIDADRGMSH
ncbi:hypothetical protein SG34_019995 [Thalassomonas viridans]|uniref:Phage baseplate protein n=1 Tax=Thalassomonas viridans TaxID=137584 RepID=A0AAE9Z1S4_9GAMM|nr:hypothetical protein [Thalassomonas viridans]WDE03647.1 hypothetical protein SG34_019995 [Thalassomonas viridans]